MARSWSKAADEAKLAPVQKDLVVQDFQPYSFWKDAVAAGVADLPSDGKIWHYNPLEALNRLHPIPTAPKEMTVADLAESLQTTWVDPNGMPYAGQNAYDVLIQGAAMDQGLMPVLLKSLVAQSRFSAKASNDQGLAGLSGLDQPQAQRYGLGTGSTAQVDGIWIFDPADGRFDPARSVKAGAVCLAEAYDSANKAVFLHFEDEVAEEQIDKFALAIYSLGSETISRAHELARQGGKTDATWEDLIEGGTDSYLCRGMPGAFNKPAKYREGTEFVSQITQRISGA